MDAILTHENADFDAMAALGVSTLLYPEAIALSPRRTNRNVRDFLNLYGDVFPLTPQDQAPRQRFHDLLLVDTQTLPSARGLARRVRVHIIDHHPLGRSLPPGYTFAGEPVGATTTLLVELLREKHLALNAPQATFLLLGIYEDTGSLSYSNTNARDLAAAAWLLEQGGSLELVGRFLHHPLDEAQRRLYDQLIKNAETHDIAGHSIVIATARAPAYVEEISTLTHQLRELYDPAAIFTLVEMEGQVQVVARSDRDSIDVGVILQALKGGGHSKAAAALLRDTGLRAAKNRLLKLLREQVRVAVTVRDIMSYGPRALDPQATIAEAAEIAQRSGHEGFPIVRKNKLVGVLTRREIDRALHHKLQNTPVKNYMSAPVAVSPDDSIEHLQRVMMEHGLGQVPVQADGEIIGIVTRTDVLKLLSTHAGTPASLQAARIAERLVEVLPPDLAHCLRDVAITSRELGFTLYIVGGFVRDLLLGRPNLDFDLVVEGDAIALGQRLVEKFGGRVHSHARFGTAKWMLESGRALDLVTARTEFYEYPTALPAVERSSIKQDLHRRDFTINTLAVCLDPDRFGQLLDPYGGREDLRRGLIRVLHNLSFIEDPTRILRAVRFETRFQFRIEDRTAELIENALDLLDRVSGPRLRHELKAILAEPEAERSLARLEGLGVLAHIHPALRADEWVAAKFRALYARVPPPQPAGLFLGLLAYRMDAAQAPAFTARLRLPRQEADLLRQVIALREQDSSLAQPGLQAGELDCLLQNYGDDALTVAAIATDSPSAAEHIRAYQEHLRGIRPLLTGHDLRRLGIPAGPRYREILAAVRARQLNGALATPAEAETWVQHEFRGGISTP